MLLESWISTHRRRMGILGAGKGVHAQGKEYSSFSDKEKELVAVPGIEPGFPD
jgi:hypothetical protein